uniref:C4-dicarboxylate ABC transporter substrate-binding protein n=1 Tax=OCS116 cluster bacterium TaxID=2030921 RepID=A0A2A4Z0T0_9PROT
MNSKKAMICAGAAAMALIATTSIAETTNILYGSFAPATSNLNTKYVEPWIQEIEEASGGDISFKFVPGGGIVDSKTAVQGLRDGVVDGVTYANVYFPTELPVMLLMSELVGIGGSAPARAGAFMEFYLEDCSSCVEEMKELNQVILGNFALGNYNLFCTKPVETLEDFDGLRIRATAPWSRMFGSLGDIVPVNVTITEAYEALQRGQADCHAGAPNAYFSYSFVDVADYFIETGAGAVVNAATLSLSRSMWSNLTEDQQTIVARASANAMANGVLAYAKQDADARQKAIDLGKNVSHVSTEISDALEAWKLGNVDQAIARAEGRGIEGARELAERYITYLNKWEKMSAEFGNDQKMIATAYWDEIFSTLNID